MNSSLPSTWRYVKLGECCTIVSGATPRRNVPEYWGNDIPWVTPKDLSSLEGPILKDTPEYISKEGYKKCSTTILPKGAILFSSRAPIGLVSIAGRDMCTNQGFKSLIPGRDVHSGYLYYCMKWMAPKIVDMGNGATFKEVSKETVSRVEIPLAPLSEQKRIATILDKADAIRRKRQHAIQLADEFLRSVFLDMFGDPAINPKGWKIEPLGKHYEELRYGTSVKCSANSIENSLPVLRIPNITAEKVNFDNLVYASLPEQERTKLKLSAGDLLFVRTNGNPDYIGRCAVFHGYSEILFASYLIRARLKANCELLPEYVQACISTKTYRMLIIKEAKTTAGNYNINTQGLRSLEIPMVPIKNQEKYLEIKRSTEKLLAKGALGNTQSSSLFNSLTQRAFRGEL